MLLGCSHTICQDILTSTSIRQVLTSNFMTRKLFPQLELLPGFELSFLFNQYECNVKTKYLYLAEPTG